MSRPATATERALRAFYIAVRTSDRDALHRVLDPHVVLERATIGVRTVGAEAVVAAIWAARSAFPDLRPEVQNVVVAGPRAAVEWLRFGTHRAPLQVPRAGEIAPTHRRVAIAECAFFLVRARQICEIRLYSDRMAVLEQLGSK